MGSGGGATVTSETTTNLYARKLLAGQETNDTTTALSWQNPGALHYVDQIGRVEANPFGLFTDPTTFVYDPDAVLTDINTALLELKTIVDDINEEDDWEDYSNKAINILDANAGSSIKIPITLREPDDAFSMNTYISNAKSDAEEAADAALLKATGMTTEAFITDAVKAYRKNVEFTRDSEYNILASGFEQTNSVNSSGFAIGLALISMKNQNSINDYTSKLNFDIINRAYQAYMSTYTGVLNAYIKAGEDLYLQYQQARMQYIGMATSEMVRLLTTKMQVKANDVGNRAEYNKLKISAKSAETEDKVNTMMEKKLWRLKPYEIGGNILSGMVGGTTIVRTMKPGRGSDLAKAASFIGAGAQIGGSTNIPFGALIGGAAGGLASFFN